MLVHPPPSVPGIGTGGGFKLYVQDRAGRGPRALEQAVGGITGPANRTPGLVQVFTLFNAATPQVYADIDRTKAEMLGVPITRFFDTLTTYMGSTYVNDFNILGRTYRVTAQADNPFRLSMRDVETLRTRSTAGDMVPLGAVATFRRSPGRSGCRATICSRPPRSRARRCRASPPARRSPPWKRSWRPISRRVSASSGPRSRCRKRSPATPPRSRSAWPWCSCSCCSPLSTRACCCRWP